MKDRIQNRLAVGDKVVVALPEAQIFGFVSQIDEGGLITGVRGRGGSEKRLGRILVSAIIALPVDPEMGMAVQLVKVYDADQHAGEEEKARPN
jgi:hypothetical protein